jgi:spore coat polysaccharide biosynthesis protein SpsF
MIASFNKGIIVYARMSSTRLPGKVLKPLGGMSILQLACSRLLNPGWSLVVATSNEASDLPIVEACRGMDIEVFRGDLASPLKRTIQLQEKYNFDLLARATADNVIPDKFLLEQLLHEMGNNRCEFSFISGVVDGVPKGVALDLFTAQFFNAALNSGKLSDEHVVGHLRTKDPKNGFSCGLNYKSPLNLTIDSPQDYFFMQENWSAEFNSKPYQTLIQKFASLN